MGAISRAAVTVLWVTLLTACGSGPGEGGTGAGAGSSGTSVTPRTEGSVGSPAVPGQAGPLTEEELARMEKIVSGAEDAVGQVEREAGTDTGSRTRP